MTVPSESSIMVLVPVSEGARLDSCVQTPANSSRLSSRTTSSPPGRRRASGFRCAGCRRTWGARLPGNADRSRCNTDLNMVRSSVAVPVCGTSPHLLGGAIFPLPKETSAEYTISPASRPQNSFPGVPVMPDPQTPQPGLPPLGDSTPLVPPLYQSSVYTLPDLDALDRIMNGEAPGFIYARDAHPNARHLASQVAALEGGTWAAICGSGMAAISAILLATLERGDRIVASNR